MARLKKDGSLSQEEALKLRSVVAPAKQRVRITIEEDYPFVWPFANDPGIDDKLKSFVKQKLGKLAGFALFDETDNWQVELPSGWAIRRKTEARRFLTKLRDSAQLEGPTLSLKMTITSAK